MRITACLLLLLALPQLSLAQDRTLEDVLHEQDTLFMIVNEGGDEFDDSNSSFPATGYINSAGDTIIPYGKYEYCFNEFFVHYTIVLLKNEVGVRPVAIDRKENILFEVMWFDNGPDWIEDGLFRIIKDENIGYANEKGEIVIKPQFACAE